MTQEETNALHLISDILDKLIDTQQESAEKAAELVQILRKNNQLLEDIKSYFSNGFKLEIKNHVSQEMEKETKLLINHAEEAHKSTNELNKKMDKIVDTLTRPAFWVKLIGAIIVSLGAIIVAFSKLLHYI